MLVSTEKTLVCRCWGCGHLGYWPVSLFETANRQEGLNCGCGLPAVRAARHRDHLVLSFSCVICREAHQQRVSLRRLVKDHLLTLNCAKLGIRLGYFGDEGAVASATRTENDLENIVFDPECTLQFVNPSVMYRVLAIIQARAEIRRINCGCGRGRLEAEVFTDRVSLWCALCYSRTTYRAMSEEDAYRLGRLESLELASELSVVNIFKDGLVV